MLRIWGRANSVNVQKVLWCCAELGLDYERIDAGMQFGRVDDADYRAMNPNGRVPTLEDAGFRLWESNSIMRYLVMKHAGGEALYPQAPQQRAGVDRWLDWTLSTLQPVERPIFWGYVRTPEAERDLHALQAAVPAATVLWRMIDRHLEAAGHLEAGRFTLADIALGAYARRWFGIPAIPRPEMPALERWYAGLQARDGFRRYVAPPLT
jgi:glutathione S-transferase